MYVHVSQHMSVNVPLQFHFFDVWSVLCSRDGVGMLANAVPVHYNDIRNFIIYPKVHTQPRRENRASMFMYTPVCVWNGLHFGICTYLFMHSVSQTRSRERTANFYMRIHMYEHVECIINLLRLRMGATGRPGGGWTDSPGWHALVCTARTRAGTSIKAGN